MLFFSQKVDGEYPVAIPVHGVYEDIALELQLNETASKQTIDNKRSDIKMAEMPSRSRRIGLGYR